MHTMVGYRFFCAAVVAVAGSAGPVFAQTSPSFFDTFFNVGNVPPGSPFDLPGAVTAMQVGDNDSFAIEGPLTPSFLGGDVLISNNQLNLFSGGRVRSGFNAGAPDGSSFNVELNMFGGRIGNGFEANFGSTVNIIDGEVGTSYDARAGSVTNISGGTISSGFVARGNSIVNMSGGTIASGVQANNGSFLRVQGGVLGSIDARVGSTIDLSGGSILRVDGGDGSNIEIAADELSLNGSSVSSLAGGVSGTDVLAGTFANGEVFIFAAQNGSRLPATTTTLDPVSLAPADTTPIVVSSGPAPTTGLRQGQTLTLTDTGELGLYFAAVGATLNIEGGTATNVATVSTDLDMSGGVVAGVQAYVGSDVEISGGTIDFDLDAYSGAAVQMSGGTVRTDLTAFGGSTVDFSGGVVRDNFDARSGSDVSVSGGLVKGTFFARDGSDVEVSGGTFEGLFDAEAGSVVAISGGAFGPDFEARSGSQLTIAGGRYGASFDIAAGADATFVGGDFRLNGSAVGDLSSGIAGSDVFTGVLEDGSTFIFSSEDFDEIAAGTTTLTTAAVAPSGNPGVLTSGSFGKGLRAGETLTVSGAGELADNFSVVGGTLDIEGGSAGARLGVAYGEVNVSGGVVGSAFTAYDGGRVNVSGGVIDENLILYTGGAATITGGTIRTGLLVGDAAVANIEGGVVGGMGMLQPGELGGATVANGGTLNIAGGSLTGLVAFGGATVNVFGTSFILDGVELTGLAVGDTIEITDRDVSLSGVLGDGSAFSFELNSSSFNPFVDIDFVNNNATLTVTLVPAPGAVGVLAFAGLAAARRRRS